MNQLSVDTHARNEWLATEKSRSTTAPNDYETAALIRSQAVSAVLEHKKEQLLELLREGSSSSLELAGKLLQSNRRGSELIEDMMKAVMTHNGAGSHLEILQLIVVAFCKNRDNYNTWTHSLCHNFEQYGAHNGNSILDFAHHREITLTLLEEVARRLAATRAGACNSRILGPVVDANFYKLKPEDLDKPFSLKTELLNDPRAIAAFKGNEYTGYLAHFLSSRTPREYLEKLVAHFDPDKQIEKYYDRHYAGVPVEYFGLLENSPQLEAFWKQSKLSKENGISASEAVKNKFHGKVSEEVVPGIFVDVDGTLTNYGIIDHERKISGYYLDTRLYEAILYLPAPGTPVTIFTGGDPEEATKRLRDLGVSEKLLPVRSKSEFKGQLLEYVIDDTEASIQGFGSVRHFRGSHFFIPADPWKQIQNYVPPVPEVIPTAPSVAIGAKVISPSPTDLTQGNLPRRDNPWWKFW